MALKRWLTTRRRSLALIGVGAAAGCLMERWLQLLVENNAFFVPGRFAVGAPFQDGLVISQCFSGSDCDLVQSVQYPVAIAANYLLTAVAFAVLARSTGIGGLVAAVVGGVILSLVITSVAYSSTMHVESLRAPAILWSVVLLGAAVFSAGWLLVRRRLVPQPNTGPPTRTKSGNGPHHGLD